MRILVTGHTGFKGSWLSAMLARQGHQLYGISLPAVKNSLYLDANLSTLFTMEAMQDIRDFEGFRQAIEEVNPDQIYHLAAQPLVLESYERPRETYETNFMGTINLLESLRLLNYQGSLIVVTTDKVYKNIEVKKYYKESDELAGFDPYSSSKSSMDLAVQSWMNTTSTFPVAIVRAGNVVGGGDWAKNRLIPDSFKAIQQNQTPSIRNPKSIRPWQHVLDCLQGYLMAMERLTMEKQNEIWNFGPPIGEIHTVDEVVLKVANFMGTEYKSEASVQETAIESKTLLLDSSKAREILRWKDKLTFNQTISWTIEFYLEQAAGQNSLNLLNNQIARYYEL
jgi:CDP-glucose 4,6-dehydratase